MTTAADADAYVTIGAEISSGRLSPNERLVEADLVDRYGLSRAAIRIAEMGRIADQMVALQAAGDLLERAMGAHLGNVARALHERARSEAATTTTTAAAV